MLVNGLIEKSNLSKPLAGLSFTETVMVDFDDMPFQKVKSWALKADEFHKLDGFIILKSSENCYHVVFNRKVTWSENMRIVAWLALLIGNPKLTKYHLMQCIKQSSTLRVSNKKGKPSPRIVYRYGIQNGQIRQFLEGRRQVKRILRKCSKALCIF